MDAGAAAATDKAFASLQERRQPRIRRRSSSPAPIAERLHSRLPPLLQGDCGCGGIRGCRSSYRGPTGRRAYAVLASSRPSSSFMRWRIRNFWILPVTVIGKLSTKRM
jgi:hypothetical protein